MKSFGKFLLLLVFIGVAVLISWKVLDSTLFGTDEDPPALASSQTLPSAPAKPVEPPALSTDDVYSSTSAEDNTLAPSPNLTCEAADEIVGQLYDLRMADKSEEEVAGFITNDDNIPDEQVDSFLNFAKSLWATPKEQLVARETFIQQFMQLCRGIEQESQSAQ